ncbi:hypothetical protein TNIN_236801 [Trichonephila inaurata madagascariensis]|uniref:Uncharacterized protein n=1 Tax=Trichonephila inaurata madagascariensis TaxID=2747483 RepID=A0A8X6XJQ0_9ARAC|nr:hypothetical protein TNIN_236801 [Trichonephila inaurata madagascariensis]
MPCAGDKKKRKKRRKESFAIYIYKVLKQVHPDTGISSNPLSIMNSFVTIFSSASPPIFPRLAHYNKGAPSPVGNSNGRPTFVSPGELAKHAFQKGTQGRDQYPARNNSQKTLKKKKALFRAKIRNRSEKNLKKL